jgi:hypothetical protein
MALHPLFYDIPKSYLRGRRKGRGTSQKKRKNSCPHHGELVSFLFDSKNTQGVHVRLPGPCVEAYLAVAFGAKKQGDNKQKERIAVGLAVTQADWNFCLWRFGSQVDDVQPRIRHLESNPKECGSVGFLKWTNGKAGWRFGFWMSG